MAALSIKAIDFTGSFSMVKESQALISETENIFKIKN
jgi:hypothetical protein